MKRCVYSVGAFLILLAGMISAYSLVYAQRGCANGESALCLSHVGIFRRGFLENEEPGGRTRGETIVGSIANYFSTTNNTTGSGNVRIRVWSRNESVQARYRQPGTGAIAVVNDVSFQLTPLPGQSANDSFAVIGALPDPDNVDDNDLLVAVIYDILDYLGAPGNVVEVIANDIFVGGVENSVESSRGKVTITRPFSLVDSLTELDINLDPSIPYVEADTINQGTTSGLQANFIYTIVGADLNQDFRIVPEATITYRILTNESGGTVNIFVDSRPVCSIASIQQPLSVYLPVC